MKSADDTAVMFAGSIPEVYDKYLVPLIFEPYAIDLAQRLASYPLTNVLELAAGTRCPFLYESIEKNQILIFNWFFDQLFGYPGLPNNWHVDLAKVLAQNDADAADRAMRAHVRFRMDELLIRLEPYFSINGQHLSDAVQKIAGRRKR